MPPLVNTRASSKLLPSTPASTSSSLLSPLVSSLGERSCQPLSSVNHLLPRGFASAAFATTLFNPLRHTLLRASLPGNTTCFIPSPTTSSRFFSSSSSTASSAPPSGFLSWYLAFLDSHPVVTKALTACTIFTVADVTSQVCQAQVTSRNLLQAVTACQASTRNCWRLVSMRWRRICSGQLSAIEGNVSIGAECCRLDWPIFTTASQSVPVHPLPPFLAVLGIHSRRSTSTGCKQQSGSSRHR